MNKTTKNGLDGNKTVSNPQTTTTTGPASAPVVNTANVAMQNRSNVPNITRVSSISKPTTIPSASSAKTQAFPTAINQQASSKSVPVPSLPAQMPTIRVKTFESMTGVNEQPQRLPVTSQQTNAVAKKRTSMPPRLSTNFVKESSTNDESQAKRQLAVATNQQPVKLWNNVIQRDLTPTPLEVHFQVNNYNRKEDHLYSSVGESTSTVNNGDESHLRFTMKQCGPNKVPNPSDSNMRNSTQNNQTHSTMKRMDANQIVSTKPLRKSHPVIEQAVNNSSTLKIGQVFECVNDDFVEDLLELEKTAQSPPSENCETSLFDDLLEEIVKEKPTTQPVTSLSNSVRIVQGADESCSDYRCNICLEFSDSLQDYKLHMERSHALRWVCDKCHGGFLRLADYNNHMSTGRACRLSANASRSFICIVDPPIILMKNQKVFAFRCKHCKDVAFQNQRNYVQHAQRHAQLFRCKKCPTKPLPSHLMKLHLSHHT